MLIGTYIAESLKSQDMTPLRVGSGLVQPLGYGYTKRVFIYGLGLDINKKIKIRECERVLITSGFLTFYC